jgi:phosphate starvation-inducible PhoH-like protein
MPKDKSRLPVSAKNQEQKEFARGLVEHPIVFCVGPAGTGKTFFTLGLFLEKLFKKDLDKIIISRPLIETGSRKIGSLPGDLNEKMDPYWRQIRDYIEFFVNNKGQTERLFKEGFISFQPLELMRGADFKKTGVLLTEAQNAEYSQLKMLLTRIGDDESRVVIDGDPEQRDLKHNDLESVIDKLEELDEVLIVDFIESFRHKVVNKICKLL